MLSRNKYIDDAVVDALRNRAVGVMPTDTIYGIVGSALDKKTVARIYRLRKRNLKKPMIILIASANDLKKFGIVVTPFMKRILKKVWPGKVSVVMPCRAKKYMYLHRGRNSLAFRLPRPIWLRELLRATGPLIAPSANIEGLPPARTFIAAQKYFGEGVDFYLDAGRLTSKPSTLVGIEQRKLVVLRGGAVTIGKPF